MVAFTNCRSSARSLQMTNDRQVAIVLSATLQTPYQTSYYPCLHDADDAVLPHPLSSCRHTLPSPPTPRLIRNKTPSPETPKETNTHPPPSSPSNSSQTHAPSPNPLPIPLLLASQTSPSGPSKILPALDQGDGIEEGKGHGVISVIPSLGYIRFYLVHIPGARVSQRQHD